ncbi:MAG: ABC transporter ATP-binding protein [Deltaproteobacteria bacterium]|jgi:branched-chain amino acid transport system ATP-binding protein|nr:MAG: ABC transporter ATP-binding protein [Deltaproteobacteria bacterium]RPH88123.1 MAG: ABC transporter ATP-binding protein [Deltaproteobacteria bacterium]
MLEVNELSASYGVIPALHGVSFNVRQSEIVTILGSNGTGKSTILNVIQGMMTGTSGRIIFRDEAIQGLPSHKIVNRGIVQVPEGMKSFPFMTVKENLLLGAYRKTSWPKRKQTLEYAYSLFPILKERSNMAARLLSGGEQQMLKIGRGLMANPYLLMVDEPSIGLAPLIVESVYESLGKLREKGLTILLTEQNALRALQLADRGYIIQEGRIVLEGKSSELMKNNLVKKAYLGR